MSENHLKEYNKWANQGQGTRRPDLCRYLYPPGGGLFPERPVLASNAPVAPLMRGLSPLKKNTLGYPRVRGISIKPDTPTRFESMVSEEYLASGNNQSQVAQQANISVRKVEAVKRPEAG